MAMLSQIELVHDRLRFPALMAGQGEPVLLLHGFPDSHRNWQHQLQALADAGFCALAPALRGYAPSCQPQDGNYALQAAVEDVCAFAAQLGGKVHLVGHDWGAVLAYLAAARSEQLFASVSMLAIPPLRRLPRALLRVPEQWWLSAYMEFFQLPLIPEWWLRRDGLNGVGWLWRRWSPGWDGGEYLQQANRTLAQPGVLRAALSWYRHLPRFWTDAHRQARHWLAQPLTVPLLVLMGERDGCMSARLLDHSIDKADGRATVTAHRLADVGHFLHLENPALVNACLIEHLRAHSGTHGGTRSDTRRSKKKPGISGE